jgi:hypothetical protein
MFIMINEFFNKQGVFIMPIGKAIFGFFSPKAVELEKKEKSKKDLIDNAMKFLYSAVTAGAMHYFCPNYIAAFPIVAPIARYGLEKGGELGVLGLKVCAPASFDVAKKIAQFCKGSAILVKDLGIASGGNLILSFALGGGYFGIGASLAVGFKDVYNNDRNEDMKRFKGFLNRLYEKE